MLYLLTLDEDLKAFRGSTSRKKNSKQHRLDLTIGNHSWVKYLATNSRLHFFRNILGKETTPDTATLFACTAATFPADPARALCQRWRRRGPGLIAGALAVLCKQLPPRTLKHKPTLLHLNRNKDYFDRSSGNNSILQPLG